MANNYKTHSSRSHPHGVRFTALDGRKRISLWFTTIGEREKFIRENFRLWSINYELADE